MGIKNKGDKMKILDDIFVTWGKVFPIFFIIGCLIWRFMI